MAKPTIEGKLGFYFNDTVLSEKWFHNGIDWIPYTEGGSGVTDHLLLTNIGTLTHAQLETAQALNNSKVGITTAQANDITNNKSKISYTDAALVASHTTSISNNTAKVGITTAQANDITNNKSKISYTDGVLVASHTTSIGNNTSNFNNYLPLTGGKVIGSLEIQGPINGGNIDFLLINRFNGTNFASIYGGIVDEEIIFKKMALAGSPAVTTFTIHDEGNVSTIGGANLPTEDKHLTRKDYVDTKLGNERTGTPSVVSNIWSGTQAQYDAISHNSNTIYMIR